MATTAGHARLGVRLGDQQKKLIERAAGLLGQSVSAFAIATLVCRAEEVVQRSGLLHLSDRDRDAFLATLDKPPAPNARLRKATRRHAIRTQ